jgi:sugar O-acyltransferase (sialic acid O-acetyltransferase NeuD family)
MRTDGGDLVLVGSGGFGRETAEAVRALISAGTPWRLLGFIDDDPAQAGKVIDGTPVLGGREELKRLPDARVVVCTGRPGDYVSRPRIVSDLDLPAERYATIVHPSAAVSSSSALGPGTVLLAHTVLTAAVRVGSHVAVMPHVTLTHDDIIEDFATLASRCALGGGVRISQCAYVGAGAIIGEQRVIGKLALVGMGAVVTKDIPAREVWAGVPAHRMRAAVIPGGPVPGVTDQELSRNRYPASPGRSRAYSLARVKTLSSMSPVTRPVKVFCWLGW